MSKEREKSPKKKVLKKEISPAKEEIEITSLKEESVIKKVATSSPEPQKIKCLHKKANLGEGRYFIHTEELENSRPDMEVFFVHAPLPPMDPTYMREAQE